MTAMEARLAVEITAVKIQPAEAESGLVAVVAGVRDQPTAA